MSADWYANVVSTLALLAGGGSLLWQVKSNWWDRPNIVFEDDRVAIERRLDGGETIDLGWTAQVTVSNTGNAETTLLAVEWEFDSAPDDQPGVSVAGNILDKAITTNVEETAPGIFKMTLGPDDGSEFQPIVLGRNHSHRYEYHVGTHALSVRLAETTRARPVARIVDRKRQFGAKRHGVMAIYGEWSLSPRTDRQRGTPLPPGIREDKW
ncbi:hypothetical protein M1247_34245 [Mycobacterium sp. 21AC1]|uniref:hypothetical protein n=1 Tax=[Mycobacterium] appelbergii TaxID=2939269 RepID=UPI002938ED6F|nr:hypothetical protein [Mycobacterium sp. 21AC1]MDV3130007.1 hypothetical protein [Mycobacterium sp. 21AC1]